MTTHPTRLRDRVAMDVNIQHAQGSTTQASGKAVLDRLKATLGGDLVQTTLRTAVHQRVGMRGARPRWHGGWWLTDPVSAGLSRYFGRFRTARSVDLPRCGRPGRMAGSRVDPRVACRTCGQVPGPSGRCRQVCRSPRTSPSSGCSTRFLERCFSLRLPGRSSPTTGGRASCGSLLQAACVPVDNVVWPLPADETIACGGGPAHQTEAFA